VILKHHKRFEWPGTSQAVLQPSRLWWKKATACVEPYCTSVWTVGKGRTLDKLTDQPGNLIPLDRVGVPDLSVSGDKFDLVEDDPHDPTTTSEPEAPM
jgi:hypothetical protein